MLKALTFYPLDLSRTRITADTARVGQPRRAATIRQCLADTLRTEGVRGLYKGLLPSMAGIVPYLSVSFTTYDTLKVGVNMGLGQEDTRGLFCSHSTHCYNSLSLLGRDLMPINGWMEDLCMDGRFLIQYV